ncbi:MAG: hypothetical protein O3A47_07840 [Chloroflexi bacterium]|nr:hypothetical protein [Chloroflexota bacterium]
MHDGIEFEKRGVPAGVICTEPFISSAKAMSKLGGIPDYPFVVLPHPLGSLSPEALREKSVMAAPEVLRILLAR